MRPVDFLRGSKFDARAVLAAFDESLPIECADHKLDQWAFVS
jgi:hypothetical protein